MNPMTYTVELEPLEEGGFAVTVPALPGCVTWGTSFDHALAMAREAVEVWVKTLQELGQPIPEEHDAPAPVRIGIQVHRPTRA